MVGKIVGIRQTGREHLMRMASVHFRADLSAWARGPMSLHAFLINPDHGGSWASGVLLPEGPTKSGAARRRNGSFTPVTSEPTVLLIGTT